uniref:Thyrotropin-releasing hormone receptor n=1 Tax=Heterorhabditis bacteriophora TaxID=37862 RepID=A0A1I7X976_HETBA
MTTLSLVMSEMTWIRRDTRTGRRQRDGTNNNNNNNNSSCSILTYLPYLAINSSSLSITAFTVERFIGICYPYRARTMCTVKRAKLIIFIIWVFSLIYHLPWMFLASVTVDSQGRFCDFKLERDQWQYKVLYLGDFSAFYVIPMFLNVVIYAKIAITLSQCGDKLKQSVKPRGAKEQVHNTLIVEARECHVTGRRSSAKGRNQVVKMLALVVLIFAICWLPYRAMVVYNSFAKIQWRPEWYVNLSKTLIYINCAINPILYNLMSAGFRRAFLSLFNAKPLTTYQCMFL